MSLSSNIRRLRVHGKIVCGLIKAQDLLAIGTEAAEGDLAFLRFPAADDRKDRNLGE